MVRVGGMSYSCDPTASIGNRIDDMALNGKPIDAGKIYRVAGWALYPRPRATPEASRSGACRAPSSGKEGRRGAAAQPAASKEC